MNKARELLKEYCKPVNHLHLMKALAEERGIDESAIQDLIDSGEYGIGECNGIWMIRKSKLFIPKVDLKQIGIDKHELLAAINTAEVFSNELNQPIKDKKWQSVKCSFHEDNHPSLRILLPDGGFECKGCGERGGSAIDLVMKLHHLSFPDSIKYLADRYTTLRKVQTL